MADTTGKDLVDGVVALYGLADGDPETIQAFSDLMKAMIAARRDVDDGHNHVWIGTTSRQRCVVCNGERVLEFVVTLEDDDARS